ncbi:MAG: class I SAM-dependent methyltransferase [Candidatus Micrarchaeota archaeon]
MLAFKLISKKESTPKNWNAYYTLPFFDMAFYYLNESHYEHFYHPLLEPLKIESTLEFGGGTGHLSMKIKSMKKSRATIIEHNPLALKKHKKAYGNATNYILGDVFNVQIKKKYDLVFSDGLVEHFEGARQCALIKKHCDMASKFVIIAAPRPSFFSTLFSFVVCYEKGLNPWQIETEFTKNDYKVLKTIVSYRYFSLLAAKKNV